MGAIEVVWVAKALSSGRVPVQVQVSVKDYERLRRAAFKEGVTVNKFVLAKALEAVQRK